MPDEMNKLARDFMEQVIFKHSFNESDALVLFNWFIDHHSTKVYQHQTRFVKLSYCGRCSTIVVKEINIVRNVGGISDGND